MGAPRGQKRILGVPGAGITCSVSCPMLGPLQEQQEEQQELLASQAFLQLMCYHFLVAFTCQKEKELIMMLVD